LALRVSMACLIAAPADSLAFEIMVFSCPCPPVPAAMSQRDRV
jgi:hypothetical protein